MLLMQRQVGDRIAIGEGIVVKVIEIQGNRVQLGIEAPREIPVRVLPPAPAVAGPAKPEKK